jgi:hypothetical protein
MGKYQLLQRRGAGARLVRSETAAHWIRGYFSLKSAKSGHLADLVLDQNTGSVVEHRKNLTQITDL